MNISWLFSRSNSAQYASVIGFNPKEFNLMTDEYTDEYPVPPYIARQRTEFYREQEQAKQAKTDRVADTITLDQLEILLDKQRKQFEEILEAALKPLRQRLLKLEDQIDRAKMGGWEVVTSQTSQAPSIDDPITRIKFQFFVNPPKQGKTRFRLKIDFWRCAPKGKPRLTTTAFIGLHQPGAGMRKSQGTKLDHLITADTKLVGRKGPYQAHINTANVLTLTFQGKEFIASNPTSTPKGSDDGTYKFLWNWDLSSRRAPDATH